MSLRIKLLSIFLFSTFSALIGQMNMRSTASFNSNWKFFPGDNPDAKNVGFNDVGWVNLNLPHDWSIELPFDSTSPTGNGGGALRGGTAWYRKTFEVPASSKQKQVFIDFDGVYMNSEVWINGHYLGIRPYGYSSFRYNLTPYLKFGKESNTIAVKVDNSKQPNSRWYSGSGIYRNVWLVTSNNIFVEHWGSFISTPQVSRQSASIRLDLQISNAAKNGQKIKLISNIYDASNKLVATNSEDQTITDELKSSTQFSIRTPHLWSFQSPYLYKAVTQIMLDGKAIDNYTTVFGIRSFFFDSNKGFFLNGQSVKINGVCNHSDLGCLGTAINTRALERQLEILKAMGCNGIRTSHNPPAPELLDLCDKMGFIVMDEAFDMWKMPKNPFDYHLYWDQWHKRDLEDMILRDRNHPSVFIWSIGNEIPEQGDPSGTPIAKELAGIVRSLDTSRPVVSACDQPGNSNYIIKSGALDLIGYNYHQGMYPGFQQLFPGKKFISTESVSGLETRGHYDLFPSDSIRRWPERWDKPFYTGNPDWTVSAYDNVSAPWGSTHEETWKIMKKYPFLSGQFIWTGFDYMGEPTPYPWPARSSYFGIIALAGFPKDVYYLYQSEWTDKTVLHLLPHWNWQAGNTVDVWAYYNHADEVELLLNGKSLGTRKKQGDDLHVMWRVAYTPGTLKAITRLNGRIVKQTEIKTAGAPAKIILTADRKSIKADGKDLSFVTVTIVDKYGNKVPDAANLVQFEINGPAKIAAVDNGSETSMESFRGNQRKAFNGMCLAVIQSDTKPGAVHVKAQSNGLATSTLTLSVH